MSARLLLDPTAAEGGAADGDEKPVEKAEANPGDDGGAAVLAELKRLQARLDAAEAKNRTADERDQADREKKLKDKGDYERLIKERDDRLAAEQKKFADFQDRYRKSERDRKFVSDLGSLGIDLVEGAAEDLLGLWGGEFTAEEQEDGTLRVVTKDLKTPAQVLKERLTSKRYEHFVKAAARGKGLKPGEAGAAAAPSGGKGDGPAPDDLFSRLMTGRADRPAGTLGFGHRG